MSAPDGSVCWWANWRGGCQDLHLQKKSHDSSGHFIYLFLQVGKLAQRLSRAPLTNGIKESHELFCKWAKWRGGCQDVHFHKSIILHVKQCIEHTQSVVGHSSHRPPLKVTSSGSKKAESRVAASEPAPTCSLCTSSPPWYPRWQRAWRAWQDFVMVLLSHLDLKHNVEQQWVRVLFNSACRIYVERVLTHS